MIGLQSKRNWKEYNEKLVRRGELYISLDFLENWDEELNRMN
ncbi:MAG: IS5/IS1182 family transposase, partial [Methanosarcinales archaeon]